MRGGTLFATFLLLAAVAGLGGCPSQAGNLTGRIVAMRAGNEVPVGDAQVRIWPAEPGKKAQKFESEAVQNLRGVSTTRAAGTFEIQTLTSPITMAEYPLLKGWSYVIEVEVPGFYITSSTFDYEGGAQYVEMQIEEKVVDVLDTSGGIQDEEKELQHGSVRKE
jgi:hypothetical protein